MMNVSDKNSEPVFKKKCGETDSLIQYIVADFCYWAARIIL